MNAVISGQAGVAVLVDGMKLASIHAGRDGEIIGRRPEEIRFLLNDARDLEFVRGIEPSEVSRRLEIATTKYDALHIALILLDGELSDDTRQTAAEELEELLGEGQEVADFPARVLFAQPFPRGADPEGALLFCTSQAPSVKGLIERLQELQPIIAEVHDAWQAIPLAVFGTEQDRASALAMAVKEGLFRDLVINRAEKASLEVFRLVAFRNAGFQKARNHREILNYWVLPFRGEATSNLLPTPSFDIGSDLVAEDRWDERSHWGTGSGRPIAGAPAAPTQAVREQSLEPNDKRLQDDLKESAHRIWLAGLGALADAEQEGVKVFNRLMDRGHDVETRGKGSFQEQLDRAKSQFNQAKAKAESTAESWSGKVDEAVASALHRLGVPTREEIRTLTQRVEELNAKVEMLKPRVTPAGESVVVTPGGRQVR